MITRSTAFVTSDNQTFVNLDGAIGHELVLLLNLGDDSINIVAAILNNREKLIDLLSTTPTSKPRARAINGGRKKRTPKADAAAVNRELQDMKQ